VADKDLSLLDHAEELLRYFGWLKERVGTPLAISAFLVFALVLLLWFDVYKKLGVAKIAAWIAAMGVWSIISRRKASRKEEWALVTEAASKAGSIVERHIEKVRLATEPARLKRDLKSSATRLRELVDSSEFPRAYPDLDALLTYLSKVQTFSSVHSDILKLREQLRMFNEEAFMKITYISWKLADWSDWVAELVQLLTTGDQNDPSTKSKIEKLRTELNKDNAWKMLRQPPGKPHEMFVSDVEPEST